MTVSDAAFGEIVGREFEGYPVAGEDADAVAAELAGEMREHHPFLIELNAELTRWELFYYRACDFNAVFFTHLPL